VINNTYDVSSCGKLLKLTVTLVAVGFLSAGCSTKSSFGHLSSDSKASAFNAELGTNYLATGELENAEIKLERANFAIFLCDQGRTSEAISQFLAASENKFYRTPEFALDNAGVCAMDANQFDLADKHMRQAIRLNPQFSPSMLHMAELKLKMSDAALADAYYSRYLTLAQQSPQSLMVGIDVKRAVGDRSAAEDFARQLVTSFPRSRQAKTFLASK